MVRTRHTLLCLTAILFFVSVATFVASSCVPSEIRQALDLVRRFQAQAGGGDLTSVQALQDVLGNYWGDGTPEQPRQNASGCSAFRVLLGGEGAAVRGTSVRKGRILVRYPADAGASVRQEGQLDIGSSGFDFDAGDEAPENGCAGARCQLVGVVELGTDGEPTGPPTDGPFEDMDEARDIEIVADGEGDILIPPLPELDEGEAYEFEVTGPEGSDLQPVILDITMLGGKITLATSQQDVSTTEIGRKYNITDYFPLNGDDVYRYRDYVGDDDWTFAVRPPIENTLPVIGAFTAFPVASQPASALDRVAWTWWLPGEDGLGLWATAPLHVPGEVVPVDYTNPRLIFPNGLSLGELGSYDADWHEVQATISQAGTDTFIERRTIRYQLQAVGQRVEVNAGTFTDTITVLWTIPYFDRETEGRWDLINVLNLGRDVGVLTWEQWIASTADPRLKDLIFYGELEEYPGGP